MEEKLTNEEALRELERREEELNKREISLIAREEMSKRGLGQELINFIDLSDRDKCLSSIEALGGAIKSEAARLMEKSLGEIRTGYIPGGYKPVDEESLSDKEYYALKLKKR